MKPAPFDYFSPATMEEALRSSTSTAATRSHWRAARASFPP